MRNKFWFLTKESIKKKIGTKSFKIVNLVLLLIIVGMINMDSVVKFFGGDFDEPVNIYVVDEAGVFDELKAVMDNNYLDVMQNYNATVKKADKTLDELKQGIIDEETDDIIIHIKRVENPTYEKIFDVDFISYEYVDTLLYANITGALNIVKESKALTMANISEELLSQISKSVEINRVMLSEDLKENEEFMELIGGVITLVFIIPVFFLITMLVQMIGAEINEEKSTKSMEIIISSVSPETHFMSKLIAANVFAITQGALLIAYSLIGTLIRYFLVGSASTNIPGVVEGGNSISMYINMFMQSEIAQRLLIGIPFFIILILLSFLAYSLFIGILASITTSMEDYQQIQTPVMIFLMMGYFLAIYASVFQGAAFIKIMAFVPFVSGILAPVMYTLGQLSVYGLLISIGLVIIVCFLLYRFGLKVYKVGILNYSSSNLWKKIFDALKN